MAKDTLYRGDSTICIMGIAEKGVCEIVQTINSASSGTREDDAFSGGRALAFEYAAMRVQFTVCAAVPDKAPC